MSPRVALVHDWLIHMRGGEKVLEALAEMYPSATIYTLFCDKKKISPSLQRMKIRTSFLQFLPGIRVYYRWLLPFFPWIIQTLKIEPVDVVISSSHCAAKAVPIPKSARHVCYCHTPMRYLWGFEKEYFDEYPGFLQKIIYSFLEGLRKWDVRTAKNVDLFLANSENVRKRIKKIYNRDAVVIYPPVSVEAFLPGSKREDFYLVVSAFVPYKKIDLVIKAFNQLDRRLRVIGTGPLMKQYKKIKQNQKIEFLGSVGFEELKEAYQKARALIFPTDEDFGIVPVEAQAAGTPVIAYGQGGALEGVQSGIFFPEQTSEAILSAVHEFENMSFPAEEVSGKVQRFGRERFKREISQIIS